jgi:hypothetical protein
LNLDEIKAHILERKKQGATWVCLSIEDVEALIEQADRPTYASVIGPCDSYVAGG